ncbi:MAG: DsbA family oxidoreductase [Cyclobacteriaceae bacterium]
MMKVRVEVVSDVVCPWCYIGKRRLERAMRQLNDKFDFEVHYLPFELNPQMPAEGSSQKDYLSAKFGGEERYKKLTDHVTQIAASEGLAFQFEKQHVSPNTRNAHRLIWLADQHGKQLQMKEALMKAYFTDGVDLAQAKNLIEIAKQQGLPEESLTDFFESEEGVAEVQFAERMNHQRGITSVPFYIINGKYGISGAQPTETFIKVFEEIASVSVEGEDR